jgi:hypothetical protein
VSGPGVCLYKTSKLSEEHQVGSFNNKQVKLWLFKQQHSHPVKICAVACHKLLATLLLKLNTMRSYMLVALLATSLLFVSADASRQLAQDALSNSNGCLDTIPKCEPGACATRNIMGVARWVCLRCRGGYEPVVTADGQDNIVQCGEFEFDRTKARKWSHQLLLKLALPHTLQYQNQLVSGLCTQQQVLCMPAVCPAASSRHCR